MPGDYQGDIYRNRGADNTVRRQCLGEDQQEDLCAKDPRLRPKGFCAKDLQITPYSVAQCCTPIIGSPPTRFSNLGGGTAF